MHVNEDVQGKQRLKYQEGGGKYLRHSIESLITRKGRTHKNDGRRGETGT